MIILEVIYPYVMAHTRYDEWHFQFHRWNRVTSCHSNEASVLAGRQPSFQWTFEWERPAQHSPELLSFSEICWYFDKIMVYNWIICENGIQLFRWLNRYLKDNQRKSLDQVTCIADLSPFLYIICKASLILSERIMTAHVDVLSRYVIKWKN